MKHSFYCMLSLITGIFLISGCHKDVYDPTALGRDYFIQNIPENFDWSTTKSLDLTVLPYDNYEGSYDYSIEIFNKNPLNESQPILYAAGWGSSTQPFRKTITIPAIDTLLYVRQTSPGNRRLIKSILVKGKELTCDFNPGSETLSTAVSTKSAGIFSEPTEIPTDAIPIEGNQPVTLAKGKNYVIRGTYSQTITFPTQWDGECNLYIPGTWEIPSGYINIPRYCHLYIMDQGRLDAQQFCTINWESYDKSKIFIAPGGQIGNAETRNITFTWQGETQLLNQGTLYLNKINIIPYNLVEIYNKGTFYANEIECQNVPYTFNNECYANIQKLQAYNGKIVQGPECSLICKDLVICGTNITLDNSSVLKTENIIVSDYGLNKIRGVGTEYALIRCNSINRSSNPRVQFSGNLYLGFTGIAEQNYQFTYPHNIVMEDSENGATIEIKASECNEGNDYEPENPEPQDFPKTILYNQGYTFASEDNFPSPGDFDLNDLVLSMDSISCYYPEKNKVSSLTWYFTLRAVGATRQLGAAIQLDQLTPSDIKRVSYSKPMPLISFQLDEKQLEKGQDHPVIPLFDNAHQTLAQVNTATMINTVNDSKGFKASPFSFEVTLEFNSPLDEALIKDNYNYFTIVGNKTQDRTEIHLPQYKHTNLSFSPLSFQEVTQKYMWTIKIPSPFNYSQEWTSIKKSYPEFEDWVRSNRQEHADWYLHPDPNFIYKN